MNHPELSTATEPSARPAAHERRTAPRVQLVTAVNLFSASNFFVGFSSDISEGGVFVSSYSLEPVGAEVSVSLGLPGGYEINARGVVRWIRDPRDPENSEPPGMGIEFVELDDEARGLIAEFVELREPQFHV